MVIVIITKMFFFFRNHYYKNVNGIDWRGKSEAGRI